MGKDVAYWRNRYMNDPMRNRAMIFNRNRKLGKETYHFMLPTSVCGLYDVIATTETCQKQCYAKKNNYTLPHIIAIMSINFQWSWTSDFVPQIVNQIAKIQDSKNPMKRFRWHSSGDFYNEEYYWKVIDIVLEFPEIKHLAYTRNIEINFNHAPHNLAMKFSMDQTTTKVNPTSKQFAYLVHDEEFEVQEKHLKPHHELGVKMCHSKCNICSYCWRDTSIVFPERKKKFTVKPMIIPLEIRG